MTKRENDLRLLRNKIARYEAQREAAIRTLVKVTLDLPGLRKREAKLSSKLARTHEAPRISEESVKHELAPGLMAVELPEDDIPDFLDRVAEGKAKDDAARATILAEQAEAKKQRDGRSAEKRKIAAEVRHAELTGQRRKMPLSGKEALAAIRAGDWKA